MKIAKVAIIGSGLLGREIALVHALGGIPVTIMDVSPAQLDAAFVAIDDALDTLQAAGAIDAGAGGARALIGRATSIAEAVRGADMVIEAVTENRDIKQKVYAELAAVAPAHAIIASNTSHLDVFALMPPGLLKRACIEHFYAPAYVLDLVDVVGSPEVDPDIIGSVVALLRSLGKRPVVLKKFVTGYIANRLQSALMLEIMSLIDGGVATPEDIDDSIKHGLAARMAFFGHLMKSDYAGLKMVQHGLANRTYAPPVPTGKSPTLDGLVTAGKLGVATGAGFFDYGGRSQAELLRERDIKLIKLNRAIREIEESWSK